MYDVYLKKIDIESVRHLKDISVDICDNKRKHLIITGKNGSGKTSLLDALARQLDYLSFQNDIVSTGNASTALNWELYRLNSKDETDSQLFGAQDHLKEDEGKYMIVKAGLSLYLSVPKEGMQSHFKRGEYVLAYYQANRRFDAAIPKHVEKVGFKDNYGIRETPRNEFVKYILDLKMTEALARMSGKTVRAESIKKWFMNFENLLRQILGDNSVKLDFDEETFAFSIHQDGRIPFSFLELSDGYAAILDIVVDLMVRMEKHTEGRPDFDLPGIVLIDEIETHLHLELQRYVMAFLTNLFPNIQFIISTHSPFVLSSVQNATVFDLENKTIVNNGLTDLPYDGIVRGYFKVDDLSNELRSKYERYKELVVKDILTDNDMEEIAGLEMYLDEIPDYLALGISTEYRRLKADFESREDL